MSLKEVKKKQVRIPAPRINFKNQGIGKTFQPEKINPIFEVIEEEAWIKNYILKDERT